MLTKKLFNRSFLINRKGKVIYKYDKIHMYDVKISKQQFYQDSKTYESDKSAKIAKLKVNRKYYKIGMTICYDLRFQHLFRDLALNGADLITVLSVFMHITGKHHWHILLKARAIETGCYIITPAQYGQYFIKEILWSLFNGFTMGEILKDAKTEKNIIITDIDKRQIEIARSKIPSLFINKKYKIS
jgi:predicted amidohydrolase